MNQPFGEPRPTLSQKLSGCFWSAMLIIPAAVFGATYGPYYLYQQWYAHRNEAAFQGFVQNWEPKAILSGVALLVLFIVSLLVRERRKRNWAQYVDRIEELAEENTELRATLHTRGISV